MYKEDQKVLSELNNKRVNVTKLRVTHAIKLLSNPVACLDEGRVNDNAKTDIAHAVNLLEAGVQEMRWACEYHDWNQDVCDQIDDACMKLGICLAQLLDEESDDYDPQMAACDGKDALSILGKVIATLERWFDETQDVSEV